MTTLALRPIAVDWIRVAILVVTGSALAVAAILVIGNLWSPVVGFDFAIYMDRAADVVAGRGLYLPRQLAGPYLIENGDSLYPPTILPLILPFLVLPAPVWWIVPLAVTGAVVYGYRPAMWTWPILAVLLAYPPTLGSIVKGNPAIWMLAALAVATRWHPAAVLVLLKPTLAPFALLGANRRDWWLALAALAVVSLAFWPLWWEWLTTIQNARGSGLLYSIEQWPMMLIPLVAWAGRR